MSSDLSRRGLLGLMAAAPVAAVAPHDMAAAPAKAAPHVISTLKVNIDDGPLRELMDSLNRAIADGYRLDGLGACPATLDGGVNDFNTLDHCQEPPPGGLSVAGHGPDALRSERSRIVPSDCERIAPGVVSGPDFSPDRVEAFLKLARAM